MALELKTYLIEVTLNPQGKKEEGELDQLMNFMLQCLNNEQRAINSVFRDWKISNLLERLQAHRIEVNEHTYDTGIGMFTERVETPDPEGTYIKWEDLKEVL